MIKKIWGNLQKFSWKRKVEKPTRKKTTERINPHTSAERIFGISPKELIELFRTKIGKHLEGTKYYPKIIRIRKTDDGRYIMHSIEKSGRQDLYEVVKYKDGIQFDRVGEFSETFTNREIYDLTLQGKGLGSNALEIFMKLQRMKKLDTVTISSGKKSTLLMLLKNGFKLLPVEDDFGKVTRRILESFGIINEQELVAYLQKAETPEQLFGKKHSVYLQKPTRPAKK
ncbi:MAG: hypothetical protein Q7K42_05390 [Candidatus Diapherotrites archaeon]|nr:hypothetical protein [Candidatus Diapherotrites archaeon]